MQPLEVFKTVQKKHLVVFVSKAGTHRAVAGLDLVDHVCEWLYHRFDDTAARLKSKMTYQVDSDNNLMNVGTTHLNSDMWRRICGRKVMFHWIAEELVQARRIALDRLRGIMSVGSSPGEPDYDAIFDAAKGSKGESSETSRQGPPWKAKKASLVPAAEVQDDKEPPIQRLSNEEFGKEARAQDGTKNTAILQ